MCGIVGLLSKARPELDVKIGEALNELNHRGPDNGGFEVYSTPGMVGVLFLGHARLSVIDLTVAGHQPMHSIDGRFTIIFNAKPERNF